MFIFLLPTVFITFLLFLLFLPILFSLAYFKVITLGFEKLGISPELTLFLLVLILFGSSINIPLSKKKIIVKRKTLLFGIFRVPSKDIQVLSINLGGAIIPILLSFYFLFEGLQMGMNLKSILIAIFLMTLITKSLAKVLPGVGILLPSFIPPLFAALFAFLFSPNFRAPAAFIIGTLGTLIGADLLNLKKAQRTTSGQISIGGAGVFDGIFLVGIISALLS